MGRVLPISRWLSIDWGWLLLLAFLFECAVAVFNGYMHKAIFPLQPHIGSWFLTTWGLLQAGWLWHADRRCKAIFWYAASAALDLCVPLHFWDPRNLHFDLGPFLFALASMIVGIVGIVRFRLDMRWYFQSTEDPEFALSIWMSLFFSTYYFQYHFHRLAQLQKVDSETTPASV